MTTLNELKKGEKCIIVRISDEHLALQLLTMGFILGEEITIERIAPLQDPMIISSGSNCLSIRKSEAKLIEIKKI